MSWKITTDIIISRSKKVHGNKYDYSKTNYINAKTKIVIICPEHGEFEQIYSSHLSGNGCPKCAIKNKPQNSKLTKEEFVIKAQQKHGDRYDYSLTEYTGSKNKIKIICKKHGIFSQVANIHLFGQGCPKCRYSKGEDRISTYLKNNEINFIYGMKFDNCINYDTNRKLCFDFYLPEYNLIIEYDGIQHFEEMGFGSNSIDKAKKLEKIQLKDRLKDQYCLENNITLLRISHKEIDKIEEILNNICGEKRD